MTGFYIIWEGQEAVTCSRSLPLSSVTHNPMLTGSKKNMVTFLVGLVHMLWFDKKRGHICICTIMSKGKWARLQVSSISILVLIQATSFGGLWES